MSRKEYILGRMTSIKIFLKQLKINFNVFSIKYCIIPPPMNYICRNV